MPPRPKYVFATLLLSASLAVSTFALAAPEPAREGVQVEKMSRLRTLVSEEDLQAESRQQYAALLEEAAKQGVLASRDAAQVKRLRRIANQLIPHASRWNAAASDWQWEINLINADQVNAFCMPGGKIAFFSGILDQLQLTDDEVAVVMGHEMSHALREHARERMAKSGLTNMGARLASLGVAAVFGLDRNLTDMLAGGAAQFATLKFSRSDETEADVVGLDLVARAGYDPRAGIALWTKMERLAQGSPPQWLSTHPSGANRIAQMQKHLPEVLPIYARTQGTSVARLPPYRGSGSKGKQTGAANSK